MTARRRLASPSAVAPSAMTNDTCRSGWLSPSSVAITRVSRRGGGPGGYLLVHARGEVSQSLPSVILPRPGNMLPDEDRLHTTLPIPNHSTLRSQFLPGL